MFANVGWGEMLVLVVLGLVILGPERLPGAIRWTSNTVRQARDYLSGATVTPAELFGRLEKACRDGIVVSDNEVTPGFATLGAPILDHNGQVCGAISVSGPREMVVGEQRALLGERLLVKAEEISRELGHAPGASLNGC